VCCVGRGVEGEDGEKPDKRYSRDFTQIGRVRVQLKTADGTPINADVKTSECASGKVARGEGV